MVESRKVPSQINLKYIIIRNKVFLFIIFIQPLFRGLNGNSYKIFVDILVELMTPKGHFEINWPLMYSGVQFGIADSIRDHCNVSGEI